MQHWTRGTAIASALALSTLLSACISPGFGASVVELRDTVTIPFERGLQGHIVIPISLEGVAGYALLDNGAFVTAIDSRFAEERQLKDGSLVGSASKLVSGRTLGKGVTVTLGGVDEAVSPMVMDLTPISQAAGKPVLAIVGEEIFARHVVEVDFSTMLVKLSDRANYVPPSGFTQLKLKSQHSAKARLPAKLDGVDGEVVLDLGSASAAMIMAGKLENAWIAEGRPWTEGGSGIEQRGEIAGVPTKLMTARTISFGGVQLNDVPAAVLPRGFLGTSDVGLGVEALDHFDLIFDVSGKRMWLKPLPGYDEPYAHAYIGVNFGSRSGVGQVELAGVSKNSPAETAGLRPGDIVVKMNGAAASTDAFRAIKPGETVDLELSDGSLRSVKAARFY